MAAKTHVTSVTWLLVVGLVFHLVYIGTVFDCYFTSPVVHGMNHYRTSKPLSKRLVLIVGIVTRDGLRADLLFGIDAFEFIPDAPHIVAPYLRSIVETRGVYGISHTRVPTESRPGHVALIAGMYEDVSAVTKGWKTNQVDFDSVFNQSSHTFSFGSPDILPMFARGATQDKVRTWCYEEHDEDFTKDATALDTWVLDQLRELFHNATVDPVLDTELRSGGVVFFLHLLGLDTTGHAYRPHSKEYMDNIMIVDAIVRQTEALITEFYGDEDTSFVFTADHGMSKIGNHGDGDPDNTRTPLVAWGKGVRSPVIVPAELRETDPYTAPFHLCHILRQDVEQADVAALMATLVGVNWPVNSVGVLADVYPDQDGYLQWDDDGRGRAEAALVNAKVILEHYRVKHDIKSKHTLFYRPYTALADSELPGSQTIRHIEDLIRSEQYTSARTESFEMIQTALAGLRYLQTYDRAFIRSLVVLAYTGWAAYAATFILLPSAADVTSTVNFYASVLALWIVFGIQRSPWSFYVYVIFPCYFWDTVTAKAWGPFVHYAQSREKRDHEKIGRVLVRGVLVAIALGCMVRAYTSRFIWSIGFVLMGLVWPQSWPGEIKRVDSGLRWLWTLSCLATGIFPVLDVHKGENLLVILVGGLCMVLVANSVARVAVPAQTPEGTAVMRTIQTQSWLILATMMITTSSVYRLQAKAGLPMLNQVAGWTVLAVSTIYPAFATTKYPNPMAKLIVLFLAFCPCFVILSISNEGLFYLSYSMTLGLWIEVEAMLRSSQLNVETNGKAPVKKSEGTAPELQSYKPHSDDLRIALFFLFFVQVGFFGTGNVASISSFYLEPVYRLMPIFRPFLMAALLVFKIVAPYVMLSAAFATLNARLRLPPFSLFLVALTLTDGMTMTFFFLVTDTGSWLEIGQTISFFCITSLLLVWSAGICAAGEMLMGDVLYHSRKKDIKVE
ncbi:PigN-domain-containing protein [Neolentinus lepideus HHB14362 ss-1]|uniref:GPI ethanolamine phosphate transferase 1 n=1 Tax=Neolentinus lepideus HHB14362 ss-1 TaxID=1314782 RepID=A0A165SDU3_9AGAM|nr:PigN-domain-containing protein [Neolentinus lepideus HHB14362 ss-1]